LDDELRLGLGVGLAVVGVLGRQPSFQVRVRGRQLVVTPERVAELELLRPPLVAGLDQVQVRVAELPGRVRLDEEPTPRAGVEVGRDVVPAVGV